VGLIKSDFATPVFDLGNPLEFPELYALSNAFDKGHLNQKGALLYSQLIGFRLAELLQDKQ
ncbi:MAG: hypothetical protein OEY34_07430, partial [Cyclobacteriaceae bacterium]|nr:hypothetical protein [Cyclobacteriaceae bacterium]